MFFEKISFLFLILPLFLWGGIRSDRDFYDTRFFLMRALSNLDSALGVLSKCLFASPNINLKCFKFEGPFDKYLIYSEKKRYPIGLTEQNLPIIARRILDSDIDPVEFFYWFFIPGRDLNNIFVTKVFDSCVEYLARREIWLNLTPGEVGLVGIANIALNLSDLRSFARDRIQIAQTRKTVSVFKDFIENEFKLPPVEIMRTLPTTIAPDCTQSSLQDGIPKPPGSFQPPIYWWEQRPFSTYNSMLFSCSYTSSGVGYPLFKFYP